MLPVSVDTTNSGHNNIGSIFQLHGDVKKNGEEVARNVLAEKSSKSCKARVFVPEGSHGSMRCCESVVPHKVHDRDTIESRKHSSTSVETTHISASKFVDGRMGPSTSLRKSTSAGELDRWSRRGRLSSHESSQPSQCLQLR